MNLLARNSLGGRSSLFRRLLAIIFSFSLASSFAIARDYTDEEILQLKKLGKWGPLAEKAASAKQSSTAQVSAIEQTGTAEVDRASGSGSCNGAFCSSALNTSEAALRNAQAIIAASSRLQSAVTERREQILQQVNRGVSENRYSTEDVSQMHRMYQKSSTPNDAQIQTLHPGLQDAALALRTNSEEMTYLKQHEAKYGRVVQESARIHEKLRGVVDQSVSLGSVTQGVSSPGKMARRPSSLNRQDKNGISEITGSKERSSLASGGGRGDGDQGEFSASQDKFDLSQNGGGARLGSSSAGSVSSASGNPSEPTVSKGEMDKSLSAEGSAMLAAMLSELKGDLGKRERGPPESGPLGSLGKTQIEYGLSATDNRNNSILGDTILALTKEEKNSLDLPATPAVQGKSGVGLAGGRPLGLSGNSREISFADIDLLDLNRSLFQRVHDQLRKKGGAPGVRE